MSAVVDGVITDAVDSDAGDSDIISFNDYNAHRPLTIDLGLGKVILADDSQAATISDADGFEKVIGSSGDDIIIAGGSTASNIAGGAGEDAIYGAKDDVADYGLEEVFGEHDQRYEAQVCCRSAFRRGD